MASGKAVFLFVDSRLTWKGVYLNRLPADGFTDTAEFFRMLGSGELFPFSIGGFLEKALFDVPDVKRIGAFYNPATFPR